MIDQTAGPIAQRIGDRLVREPRGEVVQTGIAPVWVSLETCSCGRSQANPGVGYWNEDLRAWICKHCGEPHTRAVTEKTYLRDQERSIARQDQLAGAAA